MTQTIHGHCPSVLTVAFEQLLSLTITDEMFNAQKEGFDRHLRYVTQLTFTGSKPTIETLEKGVNCVFIVNF